jgi:hypothetical protein
MHLESAASFASTTVDMHNAIDPIQAQASGETQWEPTAFALDDLFWLREQRLQCAHDHALPLSVPCTAEYSMLVEPTTRGMGTIVSGMVTSEPLGQSSERDELACEAYAQCLLVARIGQSIPIPADQSDTVTIRHPVIYDWAAAALFDPAHVGELIVSYEATVAEVPSDLYDRLEKNQLEYLQAHFHHLTAGDGE